MARKYDIESTLGPDFEFELTPEVLAYELSMDYANQVVKRCAETGTTLRELASRMGIGASTLSEKLNGQNLTLRSIAAMALALGCDVRAPEFIADAQTTCGSIDSWSLPYEATGASANPEFDDTQLAVKTTSRAKSMLAPDKKPPKHYQYSIGIGKAA
jgi:transcriptional regulator with XRE-family HTH domain